MITIRPYYKSDWKMIDRWWRLSGEIGPEPEMMPLGSSFIAEIDGNPVLAVAVYLTNTQSIAYVENFIGNPDMKSHKRKEAARVLSDHLAAFAKIKGYRRLMCMTEKLKLNLHYQELGFVPTLGGVTTFIRRID